MRVAIRFASRGTALFSFEGTASPEFRSSAIRTRAGGVLLRPAGSFRSWREILENCIEMNLHVPNMKCGLLIVPL